VPRERLNAEGMATCSGRGTWEKGTVGRVDQGKTTEAGEMCMARRQRKTVSSSVEEGPTPIVRGTPEVCPMCAAPLSGTVAEATTHLQRHAPPHACGNCGPQHTGWTLDWDGIQYPRTDVSLFYCAPCGMYAPPYVT
jgi:hypothetical protein